jgi:hypothetical protein
LSDDSYLTGGSEDTRFVDHYGTIQQIVTSSGNNASGTGKGADRPGDAIPTVAGRE